MLYAVLQHASFRESVPPMAHSLSLSTFCIPINTLWTMYTSLKRLTQDLNKTLIFTFEEYEIHTSSCELLYCIKVCCQLQLTYIRAFVYICKRIPGHYKHYPMYVNHLQDETLWIINLPKQYLITQYLGVNSLTRRKSYRKISWKHEAAWMDVMMVASLWNLTGILAALPLRSNIRPIGKVSTRISRLRVFRDLTVRRPPGYQIEAQMMDVLIGLR